MAEVLEYLKQVARNSVLWILNVFGGEQSNTFDFSGYCFLIFVNADFQQRFFDVCSMKTGKEEML